MDKSPTMELSRFASNLKYDDIGQEVRDRIKIGIVDTFGAALFGSTTPWARTLFSILREWGGKEESTAWGQKVKLPSGHAALANGMAAHSFELDDSHIAGFCHPGSVMVSSALATAERQGGINGKDLLTAITAGYEVTIRIGMCVGKSHAKRGGYTPGAAGTFGAAAAAGRILRLDEEKMAYAFHIAGIQAGGLYTPAVIKRLHPGKAAEGGVISALLAQRGLVGEKQVLEGVVKFGGFGGFCKVSACEDVDLSVISRNLGKEYEILNVCIKQYSCSRPNHTTLDAIKDMRKKYPIKADLVKRIVIQATTVTRDMEYGFKIDDISRAFMSLPYCAAVMLMEGDALIDQFTDEKIRDPNILELADKVEVVANPEFDKLGPEHRDTINMEIELKDGRKFDSGIYSQPRGSPANPATRDEVYAKFRKQASKVVPKDKAEDIIRAVERIEEFGDVSELAKMLMI